MPLNSLHAWQASQRFPSTVRPPLASGMICSMLKRKPAMLSESRNIRSDDRPSWPRARARGVARELCLSRSGALGVLDPMPPVLQQQGRVRPPEHETLPSGPQLGQGLSLSVGQLSSLILIE